VSGEGCSQEVLNSLSLSEELVGGSLDSLLGDLVIQVDSGNGSVLSGGSGAREGEHDSFGDVVQLAVRLKGNGLPLIGSLNPVAHVVDGGVTSGGSGGELSQLNDLSTSLLDTGSEFVLDPGGVNERLSGFAVNSGVSDIGVHGG